MLDLDNNGKISKSELKSVLNKDEKYKTIPESYWDQMISEVDKNGDGEIDYSEFREMMNTISLIKWAHRQSKTSNGKANNQG